MGVYNLELSIMNAKMLCTEGPSFEGWLMVRVQRSTATVESLVRTTFLGAFVGHHQDATAQGMSNDSDHELDSKYLWKSWLILGAPIMGELSGKGSLRVGTLCKRWNQLV